MKAAPPADAENSRASLGAPCDVSAPIPIAYSTRPDSTSPRATNIASVPALQANSKSATWTSGPMPEGVDDDRAARLDRVGVRLGPDVQGPDPAGSMPDLASAPCAAATEIVIVSSSMPGTDFSSSISPRLMAAGSLPHWRAISSDLILLRGMYAPYPTMPAMTGPPYCPARCGVR